MCSIHGEDILLLPQKKMEPKFEQWHLNLYTRYLRYLPILRLRCMQTTNYRDLVHTVLYVSMLHHLVVNS